MERKKVYSKTRDFIKENWVSIIIGFVIVTMITQGLALVLGYKTEAIVTVNTLRQTQNYDVFFEMIDSGVVNTSFIGEVAMTTIDLFMNAGLIFSVVYAYRNKETYKASMIVETLSKNTLSILVACGLLSLINNLLGMVPVLGWIFALVFTYASFYVLLIIHECGLDFPSSLKESFKLTKGRKLSIFLIQLRYISILAFILLLMPLLMLSGGVVAVVGVLVFGYFYLRFVPCSYIATSIYYAELKPTSHLEEI